MYTVIKDTRDPYGKNIPERVHYQARFNLKSDSCLKMNTYRKVFPKISRTDEFKNTPGRVLTCRR